MTGLEDDERTGKPKILNEAAKRILNKAKYKRGNSSRQISQQLASKGHVGGKKHHLEVYGKQRLETTEKVKKSLLTAEQSAA